MSKRMTWTLAEIQRLPDSGAWFYGLVRDNGIHLAEVFPSMGYAEAHPRWCEIRSWWWFACDVWRCTPSRISSLAGSRRPG